MKMGVAQQKIPAPKAPERGDNKNCQISENYPPAFDAKRDLNFNVLDHDAFLFIAI